MFCFVLVLSNCINVLECTILIDYICRTQEGPAYTWLFNFHMFARSEARLWDQILVPTHSLRVKGTKGQHRNLGTRELGNLGTWELGNLGTWELGNLGTWELGNLGTWELWNFGTFELGNLETSRDKKKSPDLSGQKNHPTSLDKKKSPNLSGQIDSPNLPGRRKKSPNLSGQKKITQPLKTKKNQPTSRTEKNHPRNKGTREQRNKGIKE